MICHKSKIIFIHPCRCAGTSIELLFGFDTNALNETGDRHALPQFYASKYWKSYNSFITVRNPWDRLLSAFSLIKQFDLPAYKSYLDDYEVSRFNDFVLDFIAKQPDLYKNDRLFWPQAQWLYNKGRRVKFDKVMRFETLARDSRLILTKIDKTFDDLPHSLGTSKRPHYGEIYSKEAAEVVADIYRKDIELLNYQF
jgi:hypothetical protein